MLDGRAAIPDDAQACCFCALRRCDVAEVQLEPDRRGAGGDRIVDDRIKELTTPEDVDEVDMRAGRDVREVVV